MLPDLLRDLGAPFPAVWEHFQGAHPPREAARLFAKVLGQLDAHGFDVVVPALERALRTGTPVLLALSPGAAAPARLEADVIPAALRELEPNVARLADANLSTDASQRVVQHAAFLSQRAEQIAAAFREFCRGLNSWGITEAN